MTEKKSKLFEIVDKISGDSWNGTHDRSIHVTYNDRDHITVENEYNGSGPKGTFTLAYITDEMDNLKSARYFSDFCQEVARAVPGAQAMQDERGWYATGATGLAATPKSIDAEIAAGARDNVTTLKPLTLGQAPKPFTLKLKR